MSAESDEFSSAFFSANTSNTTVGFVLLLEQDEAEAPDEELVADQLPDAFADGEVGVELLRHALEPRRDVDRVADDGELGADRCADQPDEDFAVIEPDSDP